MYSGSPVLARIMGHLPWHVSSRCVSRYGGDRYARAFGRADRYRCTAFARPTHRSGPRDIGTCPRARSGKPCRMGIRGGVSRNTPASADRARDWRIRAGFARRPIHVARDAHADGALPAALTPGIPHARPTPRRPAPARRRSRGRGSAGRGAPSGRARSPARAAAFPPSSTHPTESRVTPASWTCRLRKPAWRASVTSISVAASLSRERSRTPGSAASPPGPWTAAPAPSATGSRGRTAPAARPTARTGRGGSDTATRNATGPRPSWPTASPHRPWRPRTSTLPGGGRNPFQVDQAAPSDGAVPRRPGERREEPDPDRGVGPRDRRDHTEAHGNRGEPSRNPADSGPHGFRENPLESTA